MRRTLWIPAVLVLAMLATLAVAQERPMFTAPANSVFVGADGKFEAVPDTVLVQFNISAQDDSAQAAYRRSSEAAEQVRRILKSNGIDPKAAEVGFFSLQPVYDYRSPKRKLLGYRANTSVSLRLKDFAKVGPIVQQLADVDVTENQSLNYILENMDAAKTRAVEDAFQRARASALAVARAGGRELGQLFYSSVDTFEQIGIVAAPMARQAMRAEAAAPPPTAEFSPQKIVVTAHVNALFLLK